MIKKILISIAIILLVFAGYVVFRINQIKKEYRPQVNANLNAPIEIPEAGIVKLDEITDAEKPVVVLYYADWCTFCRRFMPEFGKTAKKYGNKFTFAIVNTDYPENAEIVEEHHIMSLPSLFIADGKLNYEFPITTACVADNSIFKAELDKYLNFRNNILGKIVQ